MPTACPGHRARNRFWRAAGPGRCSRVGAEPLSDALLLVDVLADFGHPGGDALLASYRSALPTLLTAIEDARSRGIPVVYANDDFGTWSGDRTAVVQEAKRRCPQPQLLDPVSPVERELFVTKPRYSAFDHTPLDLLLEGCGVERVLLAGTATEMCVAQTAIAAREHGYLVSVLVDACSSVSDADARLALDYLERIAGARLHRGASPPSRVAVG